MDPIETRQLRSDVWLVVLHGEHDLGTRPGLADAIDHVKQTSGTTIIIDLAAAEFIDSTVVGAIFQAHRDGERVLLVAPANGVPRRVLDIVAIDEHMPVFESRDDAIAAS
jgi:anti-anti-sigma factor